MQGALALFQGDKRILGGQQWSFGEEKVEDGVNQDHFKFSWII